MPVLRIETQPKASEPPLDRRRDRRARDRGGRRRSLVLAAGLGAGFGLLVVAGLAAAWVQRRASAPPIPPSVATVPSSDAATTGAAAAGGLAATAPPALGDYQPTDTIAWIRGEPYSYAQLLQAVRVARVLAHFTGDAVPSDTSPEMPAFQVQMLRRQIDLALLKQAMRREGFEPPPMDGAAFVETFLRDLGIDRSQLETQMVANDVTQADLEAWFRDAAAVNAFIQDRIAPGKQGADREAAIRDWLNDEWDSQEITVRFYDPDEVLPRATATAAAAP